MERPIPAQRHRSSAAALLVPGLAAVALLGASLAAGTGGYGALRPGPWLALTLCAALCGLHRPVEGSTLAVGAVALPPAILLLGPLPAAWMAGAALLLAELARRPLRRRSPLLVTERRRPLRALEGAVVLALAALAAGRVWRAVLEAGGGTPPSGGRLAAATAAGAAVYGVLLAGLRLAERKLRRPHRRARPSDVLAPVMVDLVAWGAGGAVAAAALTAGWGVAALLVAAFTLFALEAARGAFQLGMSEQRVEDLERLHRASSRMVRSPGELVAIAERIHIECRNVLRFQWFQFELLARETGYRSWWAGPGEDPAEGEPAPPPCPPALPGIHKRAEWRRLERALETEDQLVGRLRLWCDPRQVEREDVERLDALLPQMVASIQRALLDREAKHDPLTGLAVRRVFDRRLTEAWARARREGGAVAVVMCDLDHFKKINDTYGHAAGDQALAAVARLLLAQCREGDLAARYGGEEFVLLMEDTDGEAALFAAERLRRRVEHLELAAGDHPIPLTMSLGAAAFPELHVKAPEDLVELADAALYEAKRQGRNRCLLDLGHGRYRDGLGEEVESTRVTPEAPPPRIFA